MHNFGCCRNSLLEGKAVHFLNCGGVPGPPRARGPRYFECEMAPRSAWHVENAAVDQGVVAIFSSPRRYQCLISRPPHFARRCGTLISEMTILERFSAKEDGGFVSPAVRQETNQFDATVTCITRRNGNSGSNVEPPNHPQTRSNPHDSPRRRLPVVPLRRYSLGQRPVRR